MMSEDEIGKITHLIYEVGKYIHTERKNFDPAAVEHKDLHDMVSYVDKTSEEKLMTGLSQLFPGSSFIGEESGKSNHHSDLVWIIDPLDGTTNFIHNIPHYCISIGLQINGEMKAGWVYEICTDELFHAIKGQGAFSNGRKIAVSPTRDHGQSLMATGFPVRSYDQVDNYLQLLKWMIKNTRGLRRIGTAAYDLCLVACGRVEAFYEPGLSPWDVAAGSLIVLEAGGKVTDFSGGDNYLFNPEILATNGHIHEALLNAVKDTMK